MFNVRLAGGHLYGKQLFTWLSMVVSLMASFVLSFFPLDDLDEIWDLIESVSEGFLTYSEILSHRAVKPKTTNQPTNQSFVENPETSVSYCTPQHQCNSTLCGAFVVAFTVALLIKEAPLLRTF